MRSGEQKDHVERLIEQLAAVVARLLGRLAVGPPAAAEVITEAQAAQGELLGPLATALPRVDAASAVRLLRDPRAVQVYADLLRVEAAARRLVGEADAAAGLESRADSLLP